MARVHRTVVSIGFYGDDLDPTELTTRLGAPPTRSFRQGDNLARETGVVRPARTGAWILEAQGAEWDDLGSQISGALGGLTDDLSVWTNLAGRYEARVFCGLFMEATNEGLRLKPETLKAVSARGLYLDLDLYGPRDDQTP